MKQEFLITDTDTMKVFADANRLAILQLLGEPHSVKEIAAALDVPRTRLYHHINMMEERGLIEIVETRETGRIPEHLYRAAAHRYRPSDELLASPDLAAQAEATLVHEVHAGAEAEPCLLDVEPFRLKTRRRVAEARGCHSRVGAKVMLYRGC